MQSNGKLEGKLFIYILSVTLCEFCSMQSWVHLLWPFTVRSQTAETNFSFFLRCFAGFNQLKSTDRISRISAVSLSFLLIRMQVRFSLKLFFLTFYTWSMIQSSDSTPQAKWATVKVLILRQQIFHSLWFHPSIPFYTLNYTFCVCIVPFF